MQVFKRSAKQRGKELEGLLRTEWISESAQLKVAGQNSLIINRSSSRGESINSKP